MTTRNDKPAPSPTDESLRLYELERLLDLADDICTLVVLGAGLRSKEAPLSHPLGQELSKELELRRYTVLEIDTGAQVSFQQWENWIDSLADILGEGLRQTGAVNWEAWRKRYLTQICRVRGIHQRLSQVTVPFQEEGGSTPTSGEVLPIEERKATPESEPGDKFVFAISGKMYFLSGFGESGYLPGSYKGLETIAKLIRTPGVPVPWGELDPGILKDDSRTEQPIYDEDSQNAFREKGKRLLEEIETAENEIDRADSQRELDKLNAFLNPAIGLRGEARDMNNLIEKVRPKIWGRIDTVIEKLRDANPPMSNIANHFDGCISSNGEGFLYNSPAPVQWQTEPNTK